MPRKRVVTTVTEEPELQETAPPEEQPPETGDDFFSQSVSDFLGEIDGDLSLIRVHVYRVPIQGGKQQFCDILDLGAFPTVGDLQLKIRDVWGGGNYRLLVRDEKTLLRNIGVTIAGPAVTNPQPNAAPAQQNNLGGDIMQAMQRGFETLAQLLRPPDPLQAHNAMLQQMKLLKELMTPPPAPPVENSRHESPAKAVRDILEVTRLLQDNAPRSEPATGTDVILKLVESLGPGILARAGMSMPMGGNGAGMPQMLPAGPVAPIVSPPLGINAPGYRPPAATVAPYSPTTLPAGTPEPEREMTAEEFARMAPPPSGTAPAMIPAGIPPDIAVLLQAAQLNADPAHYVGVLLSLFEDDESAIATLESPDFLRPILELPQAAPFADWIKRLVAETLAELTADDDHDEDELSDELAARRDAPRPVN